tara:strand:+ start:149 stop:655 length:507 start_codon:yes stop_codon:yes gene_type:complete
MLNKNLYFILVLLNFINFYSSYSYAFESDSKEPIFLESDSAKWDEESQVSTYRGNVIVTQGSMLLTGELLIVKSKNDKINKMVITGDKATYKQNTSSGKIVNGEAKKIEHYVDQSKIIFINKAVLTQSTNIVRSNKIIYKTDTENILAGNKDGKSRVKMILEPKKDDE